MPRLATTPLRCPNCHKRENPEHPRVGPRATGAENQRTRDGVKLDVYHIKCQSCGWQWWSSTDRAKALSKGVDAKVRPHKKPAKKAGAA